MGTAEAVLPTANAFTREVDLIGECLGYRSFLLLSSSSQADPSTPFPLLPSFSFLPIPTPTGVFRYCSTYPAAIALLASGTLGDGIAKMVTHRYPLEKAAQAFEDLARGRDESEKGIVKVMIGPEYK